MVVRISLGVGARALGGGGGHDLRVGSGGCGFWGVVYVWVTRYGSGFGLAGVI